MREVERKHHSEGEDSGCPVAPWRNSRHCCFPWRLAARRFLVLRSRKLLSATVRFLLLLSADALAQKARVVRGTVTDERGQVLVGAMVQLRNNTTLQIRSYITQSDGEYHFGLLSTDVTYKVQAIYKGTYGRSRAVSRFSSRALVTIDLVIDLSLQRSSVQRSFDAVSSAGPPGSSRRAGGS